MKSLIFAVSAVLLSFSAAAADVAVKPPPSVLPPLPPVATASVPGVGSAAPVLDASFPHGLSLVEFARIVLQDVLKAPFVFADDFLVSKAAVGFSAKQLKFSGSESLLRDVLREHNYTLTKSGGYYRISRYDEKKSLSDFWYTPKHRSVGYLSSIVRPLFADGSFSYDRQNTVSRPSGSGGGQGQPVDDGGSVYSMTSQTNVDAFLFRGSPADVARLQAVLAQVDVPVPKVLVRALVLEVSSASSDAWGVSAVAKLLSDKLAINLSGNVQNMAGSLSFKGPDFELVAGLFGNTSDVSVLTAPSVYAENGAQANLSVGSSVPVLGAIQYSGTGDRSQQSVEYRDTGVILRLTPRVYDKSITLEVAQEISDAVATTTGVAGSPTLMKRSLNTVLSLASGEFAILGGLSSSKSSGAKDYIPFLDKFKLWLGGSAARSNTEVVIVLYVEKA